MLRGEQQPVGQEACAAVEGSFGRNAGKLGKIVALREMSQDDICGLAVILGFEVSSAGLVGEVPNAGKHALLNGPRVRPVAEHFEVVIGFDVEEVDGLELCLHVGRDVAEVGSEGHANAFRLKHEPNGVGGIVGNGERADGDVADLDGLAGFEVLDGGKRGGIFFGGGLFLLWSRSGG